MVKLFMIWGVNALMTCWPHLQKLVHYIGANWWWIATNKRRVLHYMFDMICTCVMFIRVAFMTCLVVGSVTCLPFWFPKSLPSFKVQYTQEIIRYSICVCVARLNPAFMKTLPFPKFEWLQALRSTCHHHIGFKSKQFFIKSTRTSKYI